MLLFKDFLHQTLTGKKIKDLFPNLSLYQVLRPEMLCHGAKLSVGLNIMPVCKPRCLHGIDLVPLKMVEKWRKTGCLLAKVSLEDDSNVYIKKGMCKADKFTVVSFFPMKHLTLICRDENLYITEGSEAVELMVLNTNAERRRRFLESRKECKPEIES